MREQCMLFDEPKETERPMLCAETVAYIASALERRAAVIDEQLGDLDGGMPMVDMARLCARWDELKRVASMLRKGDF